MMPVATVVLPWPEAGAAMTTRGRFTTGSPFDALLAFLAGLERVLDLGHLGDQIGQFDEAWVGAPAGDHDVLMARPIGQGGQHVLDVDPTPRDRIGEL